MQLSLPGQISLKEDACFSICHVAKDTMPVRKKRHERKGMKKRQEENPKETESTAVRGFNRGGPC